MPRYPECWETCGACASGEVFILEILVAPGDRVDYGDTIINIETGKVTLDISSPYAGTVAEVFVSIGEKPLEGAPLLSLWCD